MASADVKLSHPPDSVDEFLPVPDKTDVSAPKSATMEGNLTETPVTSAKGKRFKDKYKVSDTIKYDESLVGTKLKVWRENKMYHEGVVAEFYPAKKKHKVSYVDGDEDILNLRTQKWEILKEVSVQNDEEPNTEVHSEEGSRDIHKKKKSKTDPAASQEKIKDSAKKVVDVSSSGGSKGSTPKDDQSTQKTSGMSCDAATTVSKEAAKENEEALKPSSKMNTVNKSNDKTPPSSSKSNTDGPTKAEKMEYYKEKLRIKANKAQSKIRQEEERLRLEAEKMKLLKKESDLRIMMVDASVMPEMQRLYFEELQKEIIMRRGHA